MSGKTLHAHALVDALVSLGYRTAFGIPGGGIASVFAALDGRLRVVLSQHEGAAAYMAMGHALATAGREIGLCFATSGPGMTNLITGVAAAWQEQVPMFVLTGNVSTALIGKGAAQDAYPGGLDAVAMLRNVTARSITVMRAEEIVPLAIELHYEALRTRRPVHLNVPVNLASLPVTSGGGVRAALDEACASHQRWIVSRRWDGAAIDRAIAALAEAERPLVLAGHGVKVSGLGAALGEALTAAGVPALVTSHGKGILPDGHPMLLGTFGFAAPEESTAALQTYDPDVIAFLGSDLGETSTDGWSSLLARPRIKIHVDRDPAAFNRNYHADIAVRAELAVFLERLTAAGRPLATKQSARPRRILRAPVACPPTDVSRGLHPVALVQALAASLPDDALVFADIGNAMAWSIRHLPIGRRQEMYVPMALGPMGSGLCAAIGAQLARPDRPTVVLAGDCAMMMHGTELLTALGAGASVKVLVLNDGGHGMVEHGLTLLGMRAAGLRFGRPVDFVSFGRALGVRAERFDDLSAFQRFDWRQEWQVRAPMLFDIAVDPTVVPPILSRTRVLGLTEKVA